MNRIKDIMKKYSSVIKKCYSIFLLLIICGCLFLTFYWYIKPRSVEGGESHPYSEELMETDKILVNDNCQLTINLKSSVKELVNIGVFSSRQDIANENSKIIMSLQDNDSNELYSMEYDYENIQKLTVLALFPKGLDNLADKDIKLVVSTRGIDESNSLVVYKTDFENNANYYLNDVKQEGYIAYTFTGANPSYFYVWYPIMLLAIVLVFCSINDWSVLNGNKKK